MLKKTEKEWQQELTPDQYAVLRQKATELPFSGKFVHFSGNGLFCCAACGARLFSSNAKFDSQSGWPSFYDTLPGAVKLQEDTSLSTPRVEVTCANCGSHLGHLFEGEGYNNPTGKRYCINSLSLTFAPKES